MFEPTRIVLITELRQLNFRAYRNAILKCIPFSDPNLITFENVDFIIDRSIGVLRSAIDLNYVAIKTMEHMLLPDNCSTSRSPSDRAKSIIQSIDKITCCFFYVNDSLNNELLTIDQLKQMLNDKDTFDYDKIKIELNI